MPRMIDRLADNLQRVNAEIAAACARAGRLPSEVTLVAVTKYTEVAVVRRLIELGVRELGESRPQQLLERSEQLSSDVHWHLIGHLQRNKVKHLGAFSLLQALDRPSLADAVSDFGARRGEPMPVLVQVNVAGEETKGGYEPSMLEGESVRLRSLTGLRVDGVMAMAPFDVDETTLRRVFSGARAAQVVLRKAGHDVRELSMGMSGDYEIAVEEGATMVRLGSLLFGARHA